MPNIITEVKTIKVDRDCVGYPVFLSWMNTLGGREHWLFNKVNVKQIDTSEGGSFKVTNQLLENSRGDVFELTNNANNVIIVNSLVDVEDIEGLKSVLYSPSVEMLSNVDTWQTDGAKWLNVRVNKGSFKLYQSDQIRNIFEIQIELPDINIQVR
jgi:hypothetical protein